jgi:hypothetical protein
MKIFPSNFPARRLKNPKYGAELSFFNELSKEYLDVDAVQVFYSPVFTEPNEKRDIDFVIVDESRGIIFIELKGGAQVKSGSVWRRDGECIDNEVDRQINFQRGVSARIFRDVRFETEHNGVPFYHLLAVPDSLLRFERNRLTGLHGIIDHTAIEGGIRNYIRSAIPVRERDGYVNRISKREFEQIWFKFATAVLNNEDLDAGEELEEITGVPLGEITQSISRDEEPTNHGKPWTMDDERYLYNLYLANPDLQKIAEIMERRLGGIKARLQRLGLLDRSGQKVDPVPEFKSYSRRK